MAEEAAEQEGEGGAEGEAPPPPKKSNATQFILLAAIILIGQATAVYFLFDMSLLPKLRVDTAENGEEVEIVRGADAPVIPIDKPFLFPLAAGEEEILVNPVDPIMIRFLNAQVILQMESEEALAEVTNELKFRKVRELVRQTLANSRFDRLDSPAEREAMRDTVRDRINRSGVLEMGNVERVFFPRYVLN
jgi:flagellar basal body-associated protein FliL